MLRKFLTVTFSSALALAAIAQPQLRKDNIDEVLKAMTVEEKATLLVGSGWGSMNAGSMTGSNAALVPGAAGTTRAIARLGIPQTVLSDGPAGLRINPTRPGTDKTYYCTGFPVGTSMASTWNTRLVEEFTSAMGNEVKEYGADVLLAPGMNLHRNPLCGRNFEYYSEDPLLTGKMAAAYTRGIQSNGVGVSVKHFAVNDQETNRMENDARVNVRALREIYLKGFEIAVREAEPWTVMSSYNRVNGQFTQQNRDLLTTILRDEWGFGGIVMTDWGTKDGTVAAVNAGNDLMEPGAEVEIDRIVAAVKDGSISMEQLDTNVRRMLEFIVRTPRFAKYAYSDNPDLKAHAELVRKGAAEGMVLLRNEAALPARNLGNVALFGVGSYDFIAGGTGSGNVNKAYIRNIEEGMEDNGVKVEKTLADLYHKYIAYQKALAASGAGSGILLGDAVIPEMAVGRAMIEREASMTDMAIVTISRNAGEGGDRKAVDGDFTLTGPEREMIQIVCDSYHVQGKKVVVVLNIGGTIETASWKNSPDAILLAWTPGQEGGCTVADVICGASYPSGKLPMTFPLTYFDIPSSFNFPYNYSNAGGGRYGARGPVRNVDYTAYEEGIWVGYRYFVSAGKNVSYPFGYGLSYTDFEYSAPSVKFAKDGSLTASVTVKNVGSEAGKEAVQIYIGAPDGGLIKPKYELKAFAKTDELQPGDSQVLTISIDPYTLASFNESTSAWETAAGVYKVHFAASSEDIRHTLGVKLSKAQSWPAHNVMQPVSPVEEISL